MTIGQTYAKLLANLERELAEIDRDLARESRRQSALEQRRAEVIEGIDGIKALEYEERGGLSDGITNE